MLECNKPCRFCDILRGEKFFGSVDNPINENKDFFVLPTIGPLVEGWSLVIPKEHGYSMKKYYKSESFINYVNSFLNVLEKKYQKPFIVFEHGATNYGSLTACSTNHAHLHILPFQESLLDIMQETKTWKICNIVDIEKIVGNNEYLLYSEIKDNIKDSIVYVSIVSEPESQYFRKLISQKLGIPQAFDYKLNLNIELANKTHKALENEVFK